MHVNQNLRWCNGGESSPMQWEKLYDATTFEWGIELLSLTITTPPPTLNSLVWAVKEQLVSQWCCYTSKNRLKVLFIPRGWKSSPHTWAQHPLRLKQRYCFSPCLINKWIRFSAICSLHKILLITSEKVSIWLQSPKGRNMLSSCSLEKTQTCLELCIRIDHRAVPDVLTDCQLTPLPYLLNKVVAPNQMRSKRTRQPVCAFCGQQNDRLRLRTMQPRVGTVLCMEIWNCQIYGFVWLESNKWPFWHQLKGWEWVVDLGADRSITIEWPLVLVLLGLTNWR